MASINYLESTIDELLAQAKSESKPIFLHFWQSTCQFSIAEDEHLADPTVTGYLNTYFLCKRVDPTKEADSAVWDRYEITGSPTLLILNGDDVVLARFQGAFAWTTNASQDVRSVVIDLVNEMPIEPVQHNDARLIGPVSADLLKAETILYGEGEWGDAVASAKEQGKMLYYCFWDSEYYVTPVENSDYKRYTSRIEKENMWDAKWNGDTQTYMNQYVVWKSVDIRSAQGPAIFNYFGITEFNTYLFTKPSGESILKLIGGATYYDSQRDELVAELEKVVNKIAIEPIAAAIDRMTMI